MATASLGAVTLLEDNRALPIVILGHVDHGKSSLVGRLLHDTGSLPAGKVDDVRAVSRRRGRDFEWSFVIDALQLERDRGITLDTSRIWFQTHARRYAVIDAPGHREFLKNMVTGAAAAEAAVLVIDASLGLSEQTRRHASLARLLGITQVIAAINKMDLVAFDRPRFDAVAGDAKHYLASLGITAAALVPISAKRGDNVVARSEAMPWYAGSTLAEALDALPPRRAATDRPLRLPIQDVYRDGAQRIVVGRIESGRLAVGDLVRLAPGDAVARVASFTGWRNASTTAQAGQSVELTLAEDVAVVRGQVAASPAAPPREGFALAVKLFWLGTSPLVAGRRLRLRVATAVHDVEVASIDRAIDLHDLTATPAERVDPDGIGEVTLVSATPLAADRFHDHAATGRGVLLASAEEGEQVVGGCIVENVAPRPQDRFTLAPPTSVAREERARANGHGAGVLWLTGLPGAGKTTIAMLAQRALFERGRHVVVLDGDAVRQGLNRDLGFDAAARSENIRRTAEVAKLLRDAGAIVIAALVSPARADREAARAIVGEGFHEVHVAAPVEICRQRDPKGLYRKAERGEIAALTGVSAPYEPPLAAELTLDADASSEDAAAAVLISYAERAFGRVPTAANEDGPAG
jgi:bifunctional enzyme CysN/CysC